MDALPAASTATVPPPRGATAKLESVIEALGRERRSDAAVEGQDATQADVHVTLGDLSDRMEERAYGLLLLVLALPCCLPFVYLLPQIVALPMLVLAGQMALGRPAPWLPGSLRRRSFPLSSMRDVVGRAKRYLGWFEQLAHPRLLALTEPFGARLVGALLLVPAASILVPLPMTNTVPGIGVAIASVGLIERDGLLILLGLLIGFAWVSLLIFGGQAALAFTIDFVRAGLGQ